MNEYSLAKVQLFIWQMYAFPSIYPNKKNFTRLVEVTFSVSYAYY